MHLHNIRSKSSLKKKKKRLFILYRDGKILSIGAEAQHMHWSISIETSVISDFVYMEFTIFNRKSDFLNLWVNSRIESRGLREIEDSLVSLLTVSSASEFVLQQCIDLVPDY